VGRVSSPRPQYQQQRDWVPDERERLEMFGVALLLIAGQDRLGFRQKKSDDVTIHNYCLREDILRINWPDC